MGAREAEWEVWALGSRWVGPEGPGWPGAWAAGGAGCWLPPPWRAVGPVVPPPLPGCWGGGRGGLSILPPPSHLFRGRSRRAQRRDGRRLATSGDLLPGRNGGVGAPGASGEGVAASPEVWIPGCVCHPPEPSCLAPVPSGSPGSFRPRPPSVQSSSLNFWAPPLGTLTGV